MVIKGLKNVKAWQDAQHQRNVNQWCESRGLSLYMAMAVKKEHYRSRGDYNNTSWLEEYDDEICGGRGISRMHFDVPN